MKFNNWAFPLLLCAGLVGCNNPTNTEVKPTPKTEEEPTKVVEFVSSLPDDAPVYQVATTGTTPPFSMKDDYGNVEGIDVDVIRAIGENEGFKVEFNTTKWSHLFDSVDSGQYDLSICGISYKDDRAEKYALSDSYFYNPAAIMYIDDGSKTINGIEDLQGLNVAVVEGTKQYNQIEEVGGYAELSTTATPYLLLSGLVQGKFDAVAMDLPILQYLALDFPDQNLVIKPYEARDNPIAQQVVMLAKGNDELLAKVNNGIAKLKQTGELDAINEKWLGSSE